MSGEASTFEERRELRRKLLAAEDRIAAEVSSLEADIGLRIRSIDLVRYDAGYKSIIRLGGEV